MSNEKKASNFTCISTADTEKSNNGQPKKLTVFVSGLNYNTKEEDVNKFFSKCGKIERINMAKQANQEHN